MADVRGSHRRGPHRIALPHKGALASGARRLLAAAGYDCGVPGERLHSFDRANDTEFLHLRARDVPRLVAEGVLDAGITGRDLAADADRPVVELLALGFGHARVHYAAPPDFGTDVTGLQGRRVATALPRLTARDLAARGLNATVVEMSGAVELAVRLGIADAVADVVDTGRTLAAHSLVTIGSPLIRSEAVLVCAPAAAATPATWLLAERMLACLLPAAR
ncbi:ATP phosphoribosyltransferase [Micromonospora haikouensis]|uniref:ATP phosphoribosyltransferase n=1 Tax=Micromonospora haikouensis TaxID=686309 RepID=A0A1C4XDR1_9ACTN|nr:ATP phosphoribosyltransferase [Micromonospora haikouensis]SCF06606.1 ATP phosphoribosyltransferase [Micromonospora haikouensis]